MTISMLGTTNNGDWKLIGVKTMSLFVYRIHLLLSVVLQVFQNRHHNVQKRLSEVLPNQQSHQKYSALV